MAFSDLTLENVYIASSFMPHSTQSPAQVHGERTLSLLLGGGVTREIIRTLENMVPFKILIPP